MDYLALAERFIAERFPDAAIGIVAGSTARDARTPTSDIDLLLIGGSEMFEGDRTSLAATYEFQHQIFEVFAYTLDSFDEWARRGVAEYRPVIVHMLLEGKPVRDGGPLSELRATWRGVIEAGPTVPAHESDMRRYAITDLLDDLRDAQDPLERHVVAHTLFGKTAELMLLSNRQWIGSGKYLPRRLWQWDAARAEKLTEPLLRADFTAFADRVEHELERAGGRVQAGFIR